MYVLELTQSSYIKCLMKLSSVQCMHIAKSSRWCRLALSNSKYVNQLFVETFLCMEYVSMSGAQLIYSQSWHGLMTYKCSYIKLIRLLKLCQLHGGNNYSSSTLKYSLQYFTPNHEGKEHILNPCSLEYYCRMSNCYLGHCLYTHLYEQPLRIILVTEYLLLVTCNHLL